MGYIGKVVKTGKIVRVVVPAAPPKKKQPHGIPAPGWPTRVKKPVSVPVRSD